MPRTIWQQNESTYVGDRIFQGWSGGVYPEYLPVWDHEDNNWIRLNSDVNQVDYTVRDVTHEQATVVWQSDYDFQVIRIVWRETASSTERVEKVDPKAGRHVLTNLKDSTEYTVMVSADLPWGVTQTNRQTFRTSHNPIPGPVTGFRYTARTNTSITLTWAAAANAQRYSVYRGLATGGMQRVATVSGRSVTLSLKQNTKYRFSVRAVNDSGFLGPYSATIKSATGRAEKRRKGSVSRISFEPKRWGSWRSDIKWNWWPTWPVRGPNTAIYQGYWEYRNKRYWGVIEYDTAAIRRELDRKYGAGVGDNFRVTQASLRRVYRERMPGNIAPQELVWHLTNTKVRATGNQPSVYGKHVNDRNSKDSLKAHRALGAGKGIDFLRLPRKFGQAIVRGKDGNTKVTGIVLHRNDNAWNGYGYAGYAKISGHNESDYHLGGGGGRKSNLSLVVEGNWDFVVQGYQAPYDW